MLNHTFLRANEYAKLLSDLEAALRDSGRAARRGGCMVVAFHLLEAHSGGNHLNQIINHGYLAVDFFFMLSGFVIGYATMTLEPDEHGNLLQAPPYPAATDGGHGKHCGSRALLVSGCPLLSGNGGRVRRCGTAGHAAGLYAAAPAVEMGHPGMDGNASAERAGMVALLRIHRQYIVRTIYSQIQQDGADRPRGDSGVLYGAPLPYRACRRHRGGWALNWEQQYVGLVRLMYPFFGGLFLSRLGWLIRTRKNAFWWCSLMIVVVLSVPRIGGEEGYWMNGLYEAFCIICIFPVIVSMGAGGRITGRRSAAVCKFLGDISYPVYITHYPLVYIYTAWAFNRRATLAEGLPYMLLTFVGAFALAYACLKLYDLPVRRWLTERFLKKRQTL